MPSLVKDTLRPDVVRLHLEATTKTEIIHELVGVLEAANLVKDSKEARRAVLAREQQLSTGLHGGIAIPHGKSDSVDRLVAAIALKPEGADFEAVDGQPSNIFIITLSPTRDTGPHIQFMAEVSRLLLKPGVRDAILASQTPEEVLAHLTSKAG